MPLFNFIQLHFVIGNTSRFNINSLKQELSTDCFRELLQIYCKYFFDESNRNTYESNKNHSNIVNKLNKLKSNVSKDATSSSIITKLPSSLMSYSVSFLNNKSRARMSLINHAFYTICNQPIAKHHLLINRQFIISKLIKAHGKGFNINEFNNYSSITLSRASCNFRSPYIKKKEIINFAVNIKRILNSESMQYIDIYPWVKNNSLITNSTVSNHHISQITAPVTAFQPALINMQHIKSLSIAASSWRCDFNDISFRCRSCWIKQPSDHEIIDISLGDIAVSKYLINNTKLEYLDLSQVSNTSLMDVKSDGSLTPHPIFWLWNIPNLKECKLAITLPKSALFKAECDKLLASSIIINKSKKQTKFNKLSLNINIVDWTSRKDDDNEEELLADDMNIFFKNIRRIFPNLTCISYSYGRVNYLNLSKSDWNLNWGDLFCNIKELIIDVGSMEAGCSLLMSLMSMKELRVCHLNNIYMKSSTTFVLIWGRDTSYVSHSINGFVDNLCTFIENRPKSLYSLSIKVKTRGSHCNLIKTYWNPYKKYLKRLLNIIDENKIFDGYLNLSIPPIENIYAPSGTARHWFFGSYEWTKENIECSLEIAQLISKIQTKVHEYNIKNPNNKKKTILDLNHIILRSKHIKFLEFWFKNDLYLFENNKFVMY